MNLLKRKKKEEKFSKVEYAKPEESEEVEEEVVEEETSEEEKVEKEKPKNAKKNKIKMMVVSEKEMPTTPIREVVLKDGTQAHLLTIEEALTKILEHIEE